MTRRSILTGWLPLAVCGSQLRRGFSYPAYGAPSHQVEGGFDPRVYSNQPNPKAVQDVISGKRPAANAAWWGFNSDDSTTALQAAFDSPAKTVVVPFMSQPWIARPLRLQGNQEIIFEPGVQVLAKKGEFLGRSDSLFTANGASNLVVRGYGATLRMHKRDYERPPYAKAEWRMGIAIRGCKNILIEGLRVESSGGDGFYVDGNDSRLWSEDIVIRDCVSNDNYRQGISVISADNLLVDNCVFSNTGGTAPEAGIDLEPDAPNQRLTNCVIRNSLFENNQGHQMLVYLRQFDKQTAPVSIRFENCLTRTEACTSPGAKRSGYAAMAVGAIKDDGPQGLIEFRNCTAANSCKEGATIYDKSAQSAKVRFVNCSWNDSWMALQGDQSGLRTPVLIQLRRPELTKDYGGIDFVNCHIYDTEDRPALAAEELQSSFGVRDLGGRIVVRNPFGARVDLGPHPKDITLKVVDARR